MSTGPVRKPIPGRGSRAANRSRGPASHPAVPDTPPGRGWPPHPYVIDTPEPAPDATTTTVRGLRLATAHGFEGWYAVTRDGEPLARRWGAREAGDAREQRTARDGTVIKPFDHATPGDTWFVDERPAGVLAAIAELDPPAQIDLTGQVFERGSAPRLLEIKLTEPPEGRKLPVIRIGDWIRAIPGPAKSRTVWAFVTADDPTTVLALEAAGLQASITLGGYISRHRRTHAAFAAFAAPAERRRLAGYGIPFAVHADCRFAPALVPWRKHWLLVADAWSDKRFVDPSGRSWKGTNRPASPGWTTADIRDAAVYRGIAPRRLANRARALAP